MTNNIVTYKNQFLNKTKYASNNTSSNTKKVWDLLHTHHPTVPIASNDETVEHHRRAFIAIMDLLDGATHQVAQETQQGAQQVQPILHNMVPTSVTPMVPVDNLTYAGNGCGVQQPQQPPAAKPMMIDSDDDDDVPLAARAAATGASNGAAAKRPAVDDDDSDDDLPLLARAKQSGGALNNGSSKARTPKAVVKKEEANKEQAKPKRKAAPEASSTPKRARTSTGGGGTEDKPIRWNTLEHAGVRYLFLGGGKLAWEGVLCA